MSEITKLEKVYKKKDGRGCKPGERRGGRQKGTVNKTTRTAREAIAAFIENNSEHLTEWLHRIAEDDPKGASAVYTNLLEYYIPKLVRAEHTGEIKSVGNLNLNITTVKAAAAEYGELLKVTK